MTSSDDLFCGTKDRYGGVTVSSTDEFCHENEFLAKLTGSLVAWKEGGVRVVWFHVSPAQASWVPLLVGKGFSFHHANPDRVALMKWLCESEKCNVPPYAHTLVGVGGLVVTGEGQLLAVQERFHLQQHWKLPGGYVDPGEDIVQAAIREVKEETGVDTEFRPLSTEIKHCEKEISKCEWMSLEEYRSHPQVHLTNRYFAEKYLENSRSGAHIGVKEIELRVKEFVRQQTIFSLHQTNSS